MTIYPLLGTNTQNNGLSSILGNPRDSLLGNFDDYNKFPSSYSGLGISVTQTTILGIPPKHKVFISCQEKDLEYKKTFANLGKDAFIDKSVWKGDINPENEDEYIKRLIQENHIEDTTVLIVLIGDETCKRKHIDWEISAALDNRVGDKQAALIGIVLPTNPHFSLSFIQPSTIPPRLYDNFKSGYAQIYKWNDFITSSQIQDAVETAFSKRGKNKNLIDNSLTQFKRNR